MESSIIVNYNDVKKESIARTLHNIDLGKSFLNKISLYQKLRLTSGISQNLKFKICTDKKTTNWEKKKPQNMKELLPAIYLGKY